MNPLRKLCCLVLTLTCLASTGAASAEPKPVIKIGYVEGWSDSVATTYVAAQIIRQDLGYEVKLVPVSAGLM